MQAHTISASIPGKKKTLAESLHYLPPQRKNRLFSTDPIVTDSNPCLHLLAKQEALLPFRPDELRMIFDVLPQRRRATFLPAQDKESRNVRLVHEPTMLGLGGGAGKGGKQQQEEEEETGCKRTHMRGSGSESYLGNGARDENLCSRITFQKKDQGSVINMKKSS